MLPKTADVVQNVPVLAGYKLLFTFC